MLMVRDYKGENMKKKCNLGIVFTFAILATMFFAFGVLNEHFFTARNIRNLIQASVPLFLVVLAQGPIIMTGGIDLSLGAIVALANVTCVSVMQSVMIHNVFVAVCATLGIGLICGLINGLLIGKLNMPPIIVTLATTAIYEGAALMIMNEPGGEVERSFAKAVTGKIGNIPYSLFAIIILLFVVRYYTNNMKIGKALRAIGGNESAAYSAGIHVGSVKLFIYSIAGVLSALAGVFLSAQMYSGDPRIGKQYAMNAITASVVGGIKMTGTTGDIIGAAAGVFIITSVNNAMNLFGIGAYYQFLFQGVILIVVLIVPTIVEKNKNKSLRRQ